MACSECRLIFQALTSMCRKLFPKKASLDSSAAPQFDSRTSLYSEASQCGM